MRSLYVGEEGASYANCLSRKSYCRTQLAINITGDTEGVLGTRDKVDVTYILFFF